MEDKDYYVRSKSRLPHKLKCDNNLIDDGFNCIDNNICKRKKCDNYNYLECSHNNIVKTYQERLECNKNEEKIGNLCYKKCNSGYITEGPNCVKGVDSVITKKVLKNKNKSYNIIKNIIKFINNYKWYIIILFIILIYILYNSNLKVNMEKTININTDTTSELIPKLNIETTTEINNK